MRKTRLDGNVGTIRWSVSRGARLRAATPNTITTTAAM
jgi:hypothetical protein